MGTFILKRKTFDDSESKGMSTGAKIGLGVGAAAATALGVLGARNGAFGANMARYTNAAITRAGSAVKSAGSKFNNNTISNFGKKMETSGSSRWTQAMNEIKAGTPPPVPTA